MNTLSTTSNPANAISFMLKTVWAVDEGNTYDVKCANIVRIGEYVAIRTVVGCGVLTTKTEEITLGADSIYIIKYSDIVHYKTQEDRWFFYWFVFDSMHDMPSLFMENFAYEVQEDSVVHDCFEQLESGSASLASSAFSYLYAKWIVQSSKMISSSHEIDKVLTYINTRPISQNVTVEQLSKIFNISPRNLHMKFQHYLGVSPKKYILDKKYDAIKVLLLTTDMRVCEISQRTGYLSEYYFSKAFKKFCGVSPTQFRKSKTNT